MLSAKEDARIQTYFIHAPILGRIKIGKSTNVKARFAGLSCASPEWLILLGVLDGDRENEMHGRFSNYRVKHEWFTLRGELHRFVRDEFLGGKPEPLGSVTYTLDPEWVGGVPGRITLDYEHSASGLASATGAGRKSGLRRTLEQRRDAYGEVSQ